METKNSGLRIATFGVGKAFFGIDILDIQEINRSLDITKIPGSEDFIQGVLNLRGRIVTIINLGKKLGLTGVDNRTPKRNIIVESEGEHIGFLVDEIRDVIQTTPEDMGRVPPNMGGTRGQYFKGVLETDDQLIGILNIDEILEVS